MKIEKNKVVLIDYTLTDPTGKVLDSSKGQSPLPYLHGVGGIIPGLESELEGKQKGDQFIATISPEKAYGPRNEEMVQSVPRNRFPADAPVNKGTQFQANTPDGMRIVTVIDSNAQEVKIDANHPLAGVTLTFDVTVTDVREATPEELSHGHVHGPGGHHH